MLVYLKYISNEGKEGKELQSVYLDREDRRLGTYNPVPALAKTLQMMLPYQS